MRRRMPFFILAWPGSVLVRVRVRVRLGPCFGVPGVHNSSQLWHGEGGTLTKRLDSSWYILRSSATRGLVAELRMTCTWFRVGVRG